LTSAAARPASGATAAETVPAGATSGPLSPGRRQVITLCALAAAFMTQLDATIANVALPHMQASTSASREQITWVLTSYIVASAMFMPLSGWLSSRFGRKRIVLGSLIGFTLTSVLCGIAGNFGQLIAFRIAQGALGAALLPMTQVILLDINPPERHAAAMAQWGIGAVIGPIIGPLTGGWLTDNLSWRWVFFINVPFGVAAALGIFLAMRETRKQTGVGFDLFGFSMLALAVGSFQLMLDRGQMQDWFHSSEIVAEATVAAAAFYAFIVHTLTSPRPFVNLSLFRDSNYAIGTVYGFFLGGLLFGVLALVPPMLAELMHYPVMHIGLVTAPRGVGIMAAMMMSGWLTSRVDPRLLIVIGMALCGWSTQIMSHAALNMDEGLVVWSGLVQGIGGGTMFVPVTAICFSTLRPEFRNEAAALGALVRSMAASIWISVTQTITIRNAAAVQSRLTEDVRPDNPILSLRMPDFDFGAPAAVAMMNQEIHRQSLMVSYNSTYWAIVIVTMVTTPLVLLLRRPRTG